MSASFVFSTVTDVHNLGFSQAALESGHCALPKITELNIELQVEIASARSRVTWAGSSIHLGACVSWTLGKPHGNGGPSCQQGMGELGASHTPGNDVHRN